RMAGVDLRGARVSLTDLAGADLRGALLLQADLLTARLEAANLSEAQYDRETRWPSGFDPRAHGALEVDKAEPAGMPDGTGTPVSPGGAVKRRRSSPL